MQGMHEQRLVLAMKDYYVFQECKLDADEKVLRVTGKAARRLPVEEIAGLHLLSGFTLTSGVLELAAKHNIPLHFYSYYGTYRGTFFPPPIEPTGSIIISQINSIMDEKNRVLIARSILRAANDAASKLLEPFGMNYTMDLQSNTVEDLLLEEARFRKEYYALLDTVLPPFWSIIKRERRPPRRPADAILSYANGILYAKTAGWIHRAGLDPRISYLHGQKRASNPLALDLSEIMKPSISEAILLEIAASGTERGIITEVGNGVYLNEKGRKMVIRFVEGILSRSVKCVNCGRTDTAQTWGMTIPRKLHRALVTGKEPEFPVIECTLSSRTIQILKRGRIYVP